LGCSKVDSHDSFSARFTQHVDQSDEKVFQWGQGGQCAGFLVVNVQQLDQLWRRISSLKFADFGNFGDQKILRAFNKTYPELVGTLPREWDISTNNGYHSRRSKKYPEHLTTAEILEEIPKAGMMHFNGGGVSSKAYYKKHQLLKHDNHTETFGLVYYYVNLPWSWARFMVESQRRDGVYFTPTIQIIDKVSTIS